MAEITEGIIVVDEGKDAEIMDGSSCCWTALVFVYYL